MNTSKAQEPIDLDRRRFLCTATMSVAVASFAGLLPPRLAVAAGAEAIRPFHVSFPETQLRDLRHRIASTRWPDRETVTDESQGVPLATMQELMRYWGGDYDWRKCEAELNALPQFMTKIDGLDIHFIHVRSEHKNALPLIVTHGWPGSVIEQLYNAADVFVPAAVSIFPGENYQAPRSWTERAYRKPSISTSSTKAGIMPPGNSRSYSRPSCGRRSSRCVSRCDTAVGM